VRAELLRAVGGFPEDPELHGIEDYAAWLEIAERGARIRVLDEPLVRYRDEGEDRFGEAGTKVLRQLTLLHVRRWRRRPTRVALLRPALSAWVTARRASRAAR